jgi:hypothetical protein
MWVTTRRRGEGSTQRASPQQPRRGESSTRGVARVRARMDGPGALPPAGLPQSRTCGFPASGSSTHASPCAVAGPPCFAFRRLRKFAIRPSSLRCFRAAPFKRCRVPTAPFPHRVARAAIAASPLLRAAVTPRRAFHFISSSFVPQYRSRPLGGGLDRLSQGSGEPSGCVCLALQLRLVLSRLAVKDDAEPGVAVGGPLQPVAHSVSRLLVSPPSQRVDAAPDAGRPRARASSHFRSSFTRSSRSPCTLRRAPTRFRQFIYFDFLASRLGLSQNAKWVDTGAAR